MKDRKFRRNCELRAMDEPVSNKQALEALSHIVKNPQRDAEDTRTLNQAVSVLENFIYIHQDRSKIDESCRRHGMGPEMSVRKCTSGNGRIRNRPRGPKNEKI